MTMDFLDAHPSFRGAAPQLEPSLTTHRPGIPQIYERLYWQQLRQQRLGYSLD